MTDPDSDHEVPEEADSTTSVRSALETLDPAYFGFVMSTGIVSIAFRELGVDAVAWPLAAFNVGCFALLLALFGARVALFPGEVLADLRDRERHWGSLTVVVATNTVGAQVLLFFDAVAVATACWSSSACSRWRSWARCCRTR
jgi:tellurite resistance protein TehA-like permease